MKQRHAIDTRSYDIKCKFQVTNKKFNDFWMLNNTEICVQPNQQFMPFLELSSQKFFPHQKIPLWIRPCIAIECNIILIMKFFGVIYSTFTWHSAGHNVYYIIVYCIFILTCDTHLNTCKISIYCCISFVSHVIGFTHGYSCFKSNEVENTNCLWTTDINSLTSWTRHGF